MGCVQYPSIVAMMTRQIRYGINMDLTAVFISPFGPKSFSYRVGA